MLCAVRCVLCAVCCVLCAVRCVLCAVCCALHCVVPVGMRWIFIPPLCLFVFLVLYCVCVCVCFSSLFTLIGMHVCFYDIFSLLLLLHILSEEWHCAPTCWPKGTVAFDRKRYVRVCIAFVSLLDMFCVMHVEYV